MNVLTCDIADPTRILRSPPPQATMTAAAAAATTTTTGTTTSEEDPPSYFVETALEWFERCELFRQQQQRQLPDHEPPTSPCRAAWAFFRGSACLYGGTGNPFVDEALHRRHHHSWNNKLPILELRDRHGSRRTGKTHTLVSLAAKFVVATRARLFPHATTCSSTKKTPWTPSIHKQQLPQVIILDSTLGITTLRLIQAVSTQLMLHRTVATSNEFDVTNDSVTTASTIQQQLAETDHDMEDCLSRIHLAIVDDDREWIPLLEALRHELSKPKCDANTDMSENVLVGAAAAAEEEETQNDVPTLLFWDGFLVGNPGMTPGLEKEISRQVALLLQECTIGFICTTATTTGTKSASRMEIHHSPLEALLHDSTMSTIGGRRRPSTLFDIRTIVLEQNVRQDSTHDFLATVVDGNQKIPYSLSSAGVLP